MIGLRHVTFGMSSPDELLLKIVNVLLKFLRQLKYMLFILGQLKYDIGGLFLVKL